MKQNLEEKLRSTETSSKLFDMLKNFFPRQESIENILVILDNDENKQKMIEFLESGETKRERILLRAAELNRGINYLLN